MFTEEQRSWRLPDELIRVRWFFICSSIFVQKPEQQLLMGPLSRLCLDVAQTWSWWLPPPPPMHLSSGFLGGRPLEVPDLFDQVSLFVIELFVLRSVVLKLAEELNEFGLVLQQDVQDGLRLVGVGHKHLKNMESLKLDVAAFVP